MIWPFSLPTAPSRFSRLVSNLTVDRAYNEFKFVLVLDEFVDQVDLEHWCQVNFCYYFFDRVWYDVWRKRWESNGIGGCDVLVICTDVESSAVMATLKWELLNGR